MYCGNGPETFSCQRCRSSMICELSAIHIIHLNPPDCLLNKQTIDCQLANDRRITQQRQISLC